jgi:hypothetical protein
MSDKSAPRQPQPVDPRDLLAAADSRLHPLRPVANPAPWPPGTIGSLPTPPPEPNRLIVELRSSQPSLNDSEKRARAVPTGRRGARPLTRAAYRAIVRYVEDFGIDDCPSARELARRANGYALHLGLKDADLLDPESSTFREIAGDVLNALRVPAKPGWEPD